MSALPAEAKSPWDLLQHLAGPEQRPVLDQLARDDALARGVRRADGVLVVPGDLDTIEKRDLVGHGRARGQQVEQK